MKVILSLIFMLSIDFANAEELCRTYEYYDPNQEAGESEYITVVGEDMFYQVEAESEYIPIICNGTNCKIGNANYTIEKEEVGKYLIVNGNRWKAACEN